VELDRTARGGAVVAICKTGRAVAVMGINGGAEAVGPIVVWQAAPAHSIVKEMINPSTPRFWAGR